MNKITKIWVLWLALCGLLVSLFVSADAEKKNKLSLELKKQDDSCVMQDYDLGEFFVSISNWNKFLFVMNAQKGKQKNNKNKRTRTTMCL